MDSLTLLRVTLSVLLNGVLPHQSTGDFIGVLAAVRTEHQRRVNTQRGIRAQLNDQSIPGSGLVKRQLERARFMQNSLPKARHEWRRGV